MMFLKHSLVQKKNASVEVVFQKELDGLQYPSFFKMVEDQPDPKMKAFNKPNMFH